MIHLEMRFDIQFGNGSWLSDSIQALIEEQLKDTEAFAKRGFSDLSPYQKWNIATPTPLAVSSGDLLMPVQHAEILSLFVNVGFQQHLQGLYHTEFQLPPGPEQMNFMTQAQQILITHPGSADHELITISTFPSAPGEPLGFSVSSLHMASADGSGDSSSSSSSSSSSDSGDCDSHLPGAITGAMSGLAGKLPF